MYFDNSSAPPLLIYCLPCDEDDCNELATQYDSQLVGNTVRICHHFQTDARSKPEIENP